MQSGLYTGQKPQGQECRSCWRASAALAEVRNCRGSARYLPWCSPRRHFYPRAWEALPKRQAGWQERRFANFVALVWHVSTQAVWACGRDIPVGHVEVRAVAHTGGVQSCSAVLGKQGYCQGQLIRSGQGPPRCLRSYLLGGEKLERSGLSLGTKFKCWHSEPFYNLSVWCLSPFSYHSAQ